MTESQEQARADLAKLVREAQEGNKASFGGLVERCQDYARRLAYPIVGPSYVDDAVQESFLLAYRKLKLLKHPEAFLSWFCRLVLHVSYRIKKKHPFTEELPEQGAVEDQTGQVLDALILQQALRKLKDKQRDLLVMRELLQLSYDEISLVLQVPVGTVRSRLHKARKNLADALVRA